MSAFTLTFTFVFDPVDRVVVHTPGASGGQPVEFVVDAILTSREEMSVAVEDDGD